MLALHVPRPSPSRLLQPATELVAPQLLDPAPLVTQAAIPTLARYWPTASGTQFYQVASAPQGGVFTFCRGLPGASAGSLSYPEEKVMTASSSGARSTLGQQWSFIHEGSRIELQVRNNPQGFLLRIDNRFLSLDPYQSSGPTIVTLDFGSHGRRRIDIISWGMSFAGVFTDPTDCLFAAELRGPRTIVFGDSFTTPEPINWAVWFAHGMGWDDVWPSGAGGTGFVADGLGNAVALPDRVLTDVVPYRPEVVFLHAGLNDLSKDPTQVEAAAALTVRRLRDHLPDAVVAGGADTAYGIEYFSSQSLDVIEAIRAGIESAGGGWISPVELPFAFAGPQIGHAATIYAPINAGQAGNDGSPDTVGYPNGFICNTSQSNADVNLRVGSVVEIGTGATRERVVITATGNHDARLVYGFDGAMRYFHAAGEPVREVGPCFVTGNGNSLNPTGWGSADRFIGTDGFHYTNTGHRALGAVNASLLRHYLRGRPII
ncbi:SGNH/GDSL hydrolase family protein [Parerythrobacter aestuarii]|uniref:SGNH/GDSL hydrolase family protein n=1 Tax=Parerythrobacter aestuarii TaxID=3020909 RepID=UPI0024DEC2FE|nr:SGNH/GDSL hydrolase family protein [Parerythrobacter aestuarii]